MALVGDFSGASSIGGASSLATPAEHVSKLAAGTYSGLDRTNTQSDTKVITVDTAANSTDDGEATWNTTSLIGTNGPSRRLQIQDGTAGVALEFVECIYSATTPASGYNIPGVLWRDMTLHLWRRYESVTTAPNGVAGWHPLNEAYQLWKNESGGTVAATKVVIDKSAGTNDVRAFTTTTVAKDQKVVGVTLESISDTSYGVIAVVSGGAQVSILADDGEADGAIAKGDFLVSYTVAGECRTAGPQTANAIVAAGKHTMGTPMGAFAVALGTKDAGTHLVKAKLLGFVGHGALATLQRPQLWTDTTPNTTNTEVDCASVAISAKHLPMAAVQIEVFYDATMAAGGSIFSVTLYSDGAGSTANAVLQWRNQGTGDNIGGILHSAWLPTHATGAGTTPGNLFSYITASTNISAVTSFVGRLLAYIY